MSIWSGGDCRRDATGFRNMGWAIKKQSVILSTKHDTGDAYQPTAGPWDFWVGANPAVVAGRGNVFEPM